MSLADPCIVKMTEIYERVYRKHGSVPLALIRPAHT
jgi:hypothetical protein